MGKISFLSSPPGDSMRLAGRISVTAGDKIALSLGTVAPNCFPNGYEETYLVSEEELWMSAEISHS